MPSKHELVQSSQRCVNKDYAPCFNAANSSGLPAKFANSAQERVHSCIARQKQCRAMRFEELISAMQPRAQMGDWQLPTGQPPSLARPTMTVRAQSRCISTQLPWSIRPDCHPSPVILPVSAALGSILAPAPSCHSTCHFFIHCAHVSRCTVSCQPKHC